jgi:putative nucleotidyltransferase with HDIG domain
MDRRSVGAVILSAGRSSRQNGLKPALPIGPYTALEHCMQLFGRAGIEEVAVVLGHRREELAPLVQAAGARTVVNPRYREGMFSSVQAGAAALSPALRAFFVLPVDIPLVRDLTIDALLNALCRQAEPDVLVPSCRGRSGHPPLLRDRLRGKIAAHDGTRGLRGVFDQCRASLVEVPDPHVLIDIDTPEQYEKACRLWRRYGVPGPEEAEMVMEWALSGKPETAGHSRAVFRLAWKLAEAVNAGAPGPQVDADLVAAGALLHDIAKGEPDHALRGAEMLKKWGYSDRLAEIVACHADWEPLEGAPVSEIELVYLADKLVRGVRPGPLDARFQEKYERYADNPAARRGVLRRWEQARAVCRRVEQAAGRRISEFL